MQVNKSKLSLAGQYLYSRSAVKPKQSLLL